MARVYSTDVGRLCPDCEQPASACRCHLGASPPPPGDGVVRVGRQTKGRGGKAVTLITGLSLDRAQLAALTRTLKQRLGSGGAVKQFDIEIQGDRRADVKVELERLGHRVKLSGG